MTEQDDRRITRELIRLLRALPEHLEKPNSSEGCEYYIGAGEPCPDHAVIKRELSS